MASSASKTRPSSSPFRFRRPATAASLNQSRNFGVSGASLPFLSSSSTSSSSGTSALSKTSTFSAGRLPTPSSGVSPRGTPATPTSQQQRAGEHQHGSPPKENVSVTIRFRPLSQREILRGDEVAWYANGDTAVRSELNPSTAYAFDRVFGPATTTRGVYDAAAQQVVSGVMEGINGTVFAYGVTSSGKTHTMHGDQKSPGVIPLAIKDVFSIIQETPSREFLLRVSYLEIYNEVINDLLDPAGQNLRVREDTQQGTYVEGIKEEVVCSPAHALSLIAAGEEHRHVGSNNFNLLSSRSHTIFTMTVESSLRDEGYNNKDVTLSQLNLIDLAGSESSKTETTGLRRKEGAYINKSLLTLGTVIAKLSDGKASHIPYRDSKLTRLLQGSLSGHGRISLICTITPASSNNEETHNTLKFAHRAKRIEIHAASNWILDEKSLIKKYQKEITSLKTELEQLKHSILEQPFVNTSQEDLVHLRQQLEAGQVKMQSRLEEEEQAKAALMGQIQRLTKLILVSTKNTLPSTPIIDKSTHRRRHSFGEEELAYLPEKRRDSVLDDDEVGSQVGPDEVQLECKGEDAIGMDDATTQEKKAIKKRGMLGWFKLRKNDSLYSIPPGSFELEHLPNGSPNGLGQFSPNLDFKAAARRSSFSRNRADELSTVDPFTAPTQAGELFSATPRCGKPVLVGTTMEDQIDLLKEQSKMLAGEVAFCTSSLKRLIEQAMNSSDDTKLQVQIEKMKEDINEKRVQMRMLEQKIKTSPTPHLSLVPVDTSQQIAKLMNELNERTFDLEIRTADNRILREQLQAKTAETNQLRESVESLQQELQMSLLEAKANRSSRRFESLLVDNAALIEKLQQDKIQLGEEKGTLQVQSVKLVDEAAFAKELASRAAVELKNLAEEVTKLSFQNAKLEKELVQARELTFQNVKLQNQLAKLQTDLANKAQERTEARLPLLNGIGKGDGHGLSNGNEDLSSRSGETTRSGSTQHEDPYIWELDDAHKAIHELKKELKSAKEKEATLVNSVTERAEREAQLQKQLDEAKQREDSLENDLGCMWVLVAKLKETQKVAQPLQKESQESYQEQCESTASGADNGYSTDSENTPSLPSKLTNLCNDVESVSSAQLARAEQIEGGPFSKDRTTFGLPGKLVQSLESVVQEGSLHAILHQVPCSISFDVSPVEKSHSHSNKLNSVTKGPANSDHSSGNTDLGRSLEQLQSFMEEERQRGGAGLGDLMLDLNPSSLCVPFSNSSLHHPGGDHLLSQASQELDADIWQDYDTDSF
ncbi:unnamed protein product [Sphagnum compactum]